MSLKRWLSHVYPGFVLLLVTASPAGETSGSGKSLTAQSIMARYYTALYAQGGDARIEAELTLVDKDGDQRSRRFTVLRLNLTPDGSRQKVLIYFHEPADVRGLTIMVWKYPDRDDDRWMFIPAIKLVRRLSARDYNQSFVGSDFTYEDGIGRAIEPDSHALLREEGLDGRPCYVIETKPGAKASWTRQILWIDQENFLPHRREYYNVQGELERVFSGGPVEEIKPAKGDEIFPTMMERRMENVLTGHHSVISFQKVEYNVGLKEKNFTERHLRRPPRHLLR